jgi:hypothetical protein
VESEFREEELPVDRDLERSAVGRDEPQRLDLPLE